MYLAQLSSMGSILLQIYGLTYSGRTGADKVVKILVKFSKSARSSKEAYNLSIGQV